MSADPRRRTLPRAGAKTLITRATLKEYRALSTREARREQRRFLGEGVRVLEEALRHARPPEALLWCPERSGERERALVKAFAAEVEAHELPAHEIERVANAKQPPAVLGVFSLPESGGTLRAQERCLILDGVSDPGNLGTLIRSALAFGFRQVWATGQAADPWQPKVVRASAGAMFGVELGRMERDLVLECIRRDSVSLVVTAADGKQDPGELARMARQRRFALAIGSESAGVHPELQAAARLRYAIGQGRDVESLNAAIAGSIVMHTATSGTESPKGRA